MSPSEQQSEITVSVNGQAHRLPEGCTISTMLDVCGLPATGIAVAVNRTVIPRSRHPEHELHDGDTVDAVQAVGGG